MNSSLSTAPFVPQIRLYQQWLAEHHGLSFDIYDALWRWSVSDLESFWRSAWDYLEMESPTPFARVLGSRSMPGAQWFEGAQVNYARQVLRHVVPAHAAGLPAVISRNERGDQRELSWPELQRQVASLALHLQAQGVQRGDRVAAYLPNIPEAMVAFLATVSLGAIWSICAPDMGEAAVLDRLSQIEPKVLIACDGVRYAGRDLDRRGVVTQLCRDLPSVRHLLLLQNLGLDFDAIEIKASYADFAACTARNDHQTESFEPAWLPFDHPLWIVYSSGTTGLPKPIVHSHGGTVLVALTQGRLHNDLGCSYAPNSFGERYFWYSSTGWVMWNAQVAGLLGGVTCCIFDGSPAGSKEHPDWGTLWRFAAELGVSFFGAGAAFYAGCLKAGVDLSQYPGLQRVRALGSTGSPLGEDAQRWGTEQFRKLRAANADEVRVEAHAVAERGGNIWWCNISGGTDFAGAFIGGNRELPQVPGEMQCRMLGCSVEAWNDQGRPVIGEVGELVCTQPIPSMPREFWGDAGGARYLSSYFDMYPGVWRHGDWLKVGANGGCVIYGRSDATINRHGLRMGTSELYSAVEALPEVLDSLVVDLEYLGRASYMPLFVALRPGLTLDDALRERLNAAIRSALSPRFLPDAIYQVPEVPRTLSGKKQELPVKKLLLGHPLHKVVNRDAMANPACMDWFVALAAAPEILRLGKEGATSSG